MNLFKEEEREYEREPVKRGHTWEREYEEVAIFAYEAGDYHNGPRCINCGYGFCHHCQEGPTESCTSTE